MLFKQVIYNDLTDQLRQELRNRYEAFDGKVIRYRFDISHENPDPEKKSGNVVWPSVFTLTPKVFSIKDPGDKQLKRIGMVKNIDFVDGREHPNGFKSVQVTFPMKGMFTLRPQDENREDVFAFLELHPENENGLFRDPNKLKYKFTRLDELKDAGKKRSERSLKIQALNVARSLSEQEARDFALSMTWDYTDPLDVIRDKIEELAETDPEHFTNYINEDSFEYKAVIGKALAESVITYVQAENKYMWTRSGELIAAFGRSDKAAADLFTDWLKTHKSGPGAYRQIKELVTPKKVPAQ